MKKVTPQSGTIILICRKRSALWRNGGGTFGTYPPYAFCSRVRNMYFCRTTYSWRDLFDLPTGTSRTIETGNVRFCLVPYMICGSLNMTSNLGVLLSSYIRSAFCADRTSKPWLQLRAKPKSEYNDGISGQEVEIAVGLGRNYIRCSYLRLDVL